MAGLVVPGLPHHVTQRARQRAGAGLAPSNNSIDMFFLCSYTCYLTELRQSGSSSL